MTPVKGTRQLQGRARRRAAFFCPCWHAPPATADIVLSAYQEVAHASEEAAMRPAPLPSASTCRAACWHHGWQLPAPARSASADPAVAGQRQAAKDTATTSSVPASSLAGTATQPLADPAERALHGLSSADPLPLLRAKATDKAGRKLIAEARNESAGNGIPPASPGAPPRHAHPRARSRPTGTPPHALPSFAVNTARRSRRIQDIGLA